MVVPEHVEQFGSQSASSIGVLISAVVEPEVELSSDATESPFAVTMSIPNEPVSPVVDGLSNNPKSKPNWPEFVSLGKRPSIIIIVFPLESVLTVQVKVTDVSKRLVQVSSTVDPPEFEVEIVTSLGKVIITTESVGIEVSAVNIIL